MNRVYIAVFYILVIMLLGGCGYPQEKKQQLDKLNEQLLNVQLAVDQYYDEIKVYPYRYINDERKLTTKYLVNFQDISSRLSTIPSTAFEKGGNFIYVLSDVDKKATVKLFDLRIQDSVEEVQSALRWYVKNKQALPIGEEVGPMMYVLDLQKLNMSEKAIESPFSPGERRGFLVDNTGEVYVDFRIDVMRCIQNREFKVDMKEDLRVLLSQESFYVAAYSPNMKYSQGRLVVLPVK